MEKIKQSAKLINSYSSAAALRRVRMLWGIYPLVNIAAGWLYSRAFQLCKNCFHPGFLKVTDADRLHKGQGAKIKHNVLFLVSKAKISYDRRKSVKR